MATLAVGAGLGLAFLTGSASLVAAESDDCPTATEAVGTMPDEPAMDMDMEMTDESTMDMDQGGGEDMGHEMSDGGNIDMLQAMMAAMHDAMMGADSMGHMHGAMMAAMHEAMTGASEDAEGAAACDGEEPTR